MNDESALWSTTKCGVLDYALRKATDDHEDLGFMVNPRRSRRRRTEKISDLNATDDIPLLSDDLSTAQELLLRVGAECG